MPQPLTMSEGGISDEDDSGGDEDDSGGDEEEIVHTIGLRREFQCPGGSLLVIKQAATKRNDSTQEELETVYLR
jgi:hypothetical protein